MLVIVSLKAATNLHSWNWWWARSS